jgi:hypothetical protein
MRTLQIGDMFCGAGGSTTGIRQAIDAMEEIIRMIPKEKLVLINIKRRRYGFNCHRKDA